MRQVSEQHVECSTTTKAAEPFAVDNPVQIPEWKNKQEKYPWRAILKWALLSILYITEMKEESIKSECYYRDKGENREWLLSAKKYISFISSKRWKRVKKSVLKFMFQGEKKLRGRKGCKSKKVTAETGVHGCRNVTRQTQHQTNQQRLGMDLRRSRSEGRDKRKNTLKQESSWAEETGE